MNLILIISSSMDEQTSLEEAVKANPPKEKYTFTSTASFGQEASWWIDNRPDVLIISLPAEPEFQDLFLNKMRTDLPKDISLMVLTPEVTPDLLKLSKHFSNLRVIKGPLKGEALFKSVHDFIEYSAPDRRQVHQRHVVDIPCRIKVPGLDDMYEGRAKNISIGGVYVETKVLLRLQAEDKVLLTFILGDVQKEYQMDARVVWIKGIHGGQAQAIGLRDRKSVV